MIRATHLLVGLTQFAMKETEQPPVSVCLVFRETLTLNANLSAPSTRSAPRTWHAFGKSVRILVQEFVVPMPHAPSITTTLFANVILAMKGIHSPIATEKQHVSKS